MYDKGKLSITDLLRHVYIDIPFLMIPYMESICPNHLEIVVLILLIFVDIFLFVKIVLIDFSRLLQM